MAKVPLDTVMDALRTIHDKGDSDHFMEAAKAAKVGVAIPPKTINFVKNYIKENKLQSHAATKKVVLCPHPYYCPPASSGQ
jgi:hypothetical protein